MKKHNFEQTPKLLETFDQLIRSSEIRSSDHFPKLLLLINFFKRKKEEKKERNKERKKETKKEIMKERKKEKCHGGPSTLTFIAFLLTN